MENPLINGIEILGSTSLPSEDQLKEVEVIIVEKDVEMQVEESTNVKLYPNPSQSDVYLQFLDPSVQLTSISLSDNNGRFIKAYDNYLFKNQGEGEYMFNISEMSDGVYILKIFTNNFKVFTLRLIKKE